MTGFDVVLDERGAGRDRAGDLVSVAVSVCNAAADMSECLDCIEQQSHPRLELIVVDDASTDATCATAVDWMQRRGDRFERRRLLRQRASQGLPVARNLAFEAADGDAVLVLDADSRVFPRALARLHETMVDTGAAVTYSHLVYLGGEAQGVRVAPDWGGAAFLSDNSVEGAALVDRRAWAKVGGYASLDGGWEHYDLWCKFMEAEFYGVLAPELLCARRADSGSSPAAPTVEGRRRLVYRMLSAHPWLELRV